MCRLLLVQSTSPFAPESFLKPFADACRDSCEYQGHGWGLLRVPRWSRRWHEYKNISPIWEDDLTRFGPTTVLLVHARSAFRDEGIVLANNMPFAAAGWGFAFNGELRGVRVRSDGPTGAARIWHLIQRAHFTAGLPMRDAVARTIAMLEQRSEYVRAINILMSNGDRAILHTTYSESPEYFTIHQHESPDGNLIVTSSEPFGLPSSVSAPSPTSQIWHPVANRSTLTW